jgi:hypothetical protein
MFWLKGCPICGGDIQEEGDKFGPYVVCIQCAYYPSELEINRLRLSARPPIRRTSAPGERVPAKTAS